MDVRSHAISTHDGTTLNCWERSPHTADEAVLFVHGSITNARALFVTPVPNDTSYSWLHAASDRGRAAYALDIRGYGDSDLPPAMSDPPESNPPPVRADLAADDVATALEFVRESHDIVHLVGVSWGAHVCGRLAARESPQITTLTQCAPAYKPRYTVEDGLATLGLDRLDVAWFKQQKSTVKDRQGGDPSLFEAIWQAQIESNQGIDGETFVAQAGGLADWAASCAGDPPWDPKHIAVPTLVIRGRADSIADRPGSLDHVDEMVLPDDRVDYIEIGGADHYPMHGPRRGEFFEVVHQCQTRLAR